MGEERGLTIAQSTADRVICPTHGDIGSLGLEGAPTIEFSVDGMQRFCTHCWRDWMLENLSHGLCTVE